MADKTAVVIGAGPAGLTAAYELLERSSVRPIVYEMSADIGGIAKTIDYKGNKMDLGGHRFFSKSDRVMEWWLNIFPLQGKPAKDDIALGRTPALSIRSGAPDPEKDDEVMLVRGRISRIFFLRKFFDYPISLNGNTIKNLGPSRLTKIAVSYARTRCFPIRDERTLEEFFINRFGRELYRTFFEDYTEKVWGKPCREITAEWGAQRIKGLSITKALTHAVKRIIKKDGSLAQKQTETSLIEQFIYPKFGPGQLWERVASSIGERGGQIYLNHSVVGVISDGRRITGVKVQDGAGGECRQVEADYFISTMPMKDLVASLEGAPVPEDVYEAALGLQYRDFMTVGLLLRKLKISNGTGVRTVNHIVPDNWIYIQERDVRVGRLQIFNNWSPYLVKDERTVWLGLEYFCNAGDDLWSMRDDEFASFAIDELEKIGIIDKEDVLDHMVARMPKTYPAYFGTYGQLGTVRRFLDGIDNLFLVGRNGMHRYNNTDHSMLTAMTAVDNIVGGITAKDNIWAVNTEEEYHEEK